AYVLEGLVLQSLVFGRFFSRGLFPLTLPAAPPAAPARPNSRDLSFTGGARAPPVLSCAQRFAAHSECSIASQAFMAPTPAPSTPSEDHDQHASPFSTV